MLAQGPDEDGEPRQPTVHSRPEPTTSTSHSRFSRYLRFARRRRHEANEQGPPPPPPPPPIPVSTAVRANEGFVVTSRKRSATTTSGPNTPASGSASVSAVATPALTFSQPGKALGQGQGQVRKFSFPKGSPTYAV